MFAPYPESSSTENMRPTLSSLIAVLKTINSSRRKVEIIEKSLIGEECMIENMVLECCESRIKGERFSDK